MKKVIALSLVLIMSFGCATSKTPKRTYDPAPRGMVSVYDSQTGQKRNMTIEEYNNLRRSDKAAHKKNILISLAVGVAITVVAARNEWFPGQTD